MNFTKLLEESKRPLLILGAGVRQAGQAERIEAFVNQINIPVLLTWGGMDLLPYDHPLNCGGFGLCGPIGGNLALAESDFILNMGARLNTQEIGNDASEFAPNAVKVIIENDYAEITRLAKLPMQTIILEQDLRDIMTRTDLHHPGVLDWVQRIQNYRKLYPVGESASRDDLNNLSPYRVIEQINAMSSEDDIILTDAGATLCWVMQTWKVKQGQRLISSWNHSPMGWALPASIGAAFARPESHIFCIMGDGSFLMNLQTLALVRQHNLNIFIFVFDNLGYGIIRQTQDIWLNGRRHASVMMENNLTFMCVSFGLKTLNWRNPEISIDLTAPICYRVFIDPEAKIVPKSKTGKLEIPIDKSINID